jgi:integrase
VTQLIPEDADDAGLLDAWGKLRGENIQMWLAVGLARFAGLRKCEIEGCRGTWIVQRGEGVAVLLMDRDNEDGRPDFRTKTGKIYYAHIIHPELADYLAALSKNESLRDQRIITQNQEWMIRHVQNWIRPFTGKTIKPLHRLRGLYADHIKRLTEDALRISQAGTAAASKALGHTSIATTEKHYLSDSDKIIRMA